MRQRSHSEWVLRKQQLSSSDDSSESSACSNQSQPEESPRRMEKAGDVKDVVRLITFDGLPKWRRDNPFIVYGYRQTHISMRGIFKSLFMLTNETFNIWVHLLAGAFFIIGGHYSLRILEMQHGEGEHFIMDWLVWTLFYFGLACCFLFSAAFHLFKPNSYEMYLKVVKLDYLGIVTNLVGSCYPCIYYLWYCDMRICAFYLFFTALASVACAAACVLPYFNNHRGARVSIFLATSVVSGHAPYWHALYHMLSTIGLDSIWRYPVLIGEPLQLVVYIFAIASYINRFPEKHIGSAWNYKYMPSSHNIWHVACVVNSCIHGYTLYLTFLSRNAEECPVES